ncbi:hypothetical protein HPB49_004566 [Dermacentor silvarum]|uniref:Uncharacterized protein n=1 Tax=Dermacentor silvarum TaxID=543639 RepID=A0ACB8CJG0_DERSI|nr:hypothetical protein HPB49_004566 [Dermacentor silvarum]
MSKESKEIAKQFEEFRRELRLEIRSLKESVKYCSDTSDSVSEIQRDIKELKLDMKKLVEKNVQLEHENQGLRDRIDELEQYQRLNNIEVKGLPDGCNATAAIKAIGMKLGETIDDLDVDVCHMVETSKGRGKNLIVRFTRRSKRNAILAKARKARLTTQSLEYAGQSRPIFVNEHLTRKNKQLLGAAISRKKVVGWKHVCSSNGRVLARRGDSTPVLHIVSLADVDRMTASSPTAGPETEQFHA